jgi:hypothetical protein
MIMPTDKTAISPQVYQIKITLLGTRPAIWRRLLVPADLTLLQLHNVIQIAMGWDDSHLHEFYIGKQAFGEPDPMATFLDRPKSGNERTTRLSSVLGKVRAKAKYLYDFGDGWEHEIVVEKILASEPGQVYPICVAGELSGPPEDCGGLGGFYNLLEAIADPEHEQHEELQDWVGEDFDPTSFSMDAVNRQLARLQQRRSKATAGQ